jgi:hypothetical protein
MPHLVTNSYVPILAAEELGVYREEGRDAHVELRPSPPRCTRCGMAPWTSRPSKRWGSGRQGCLFQLQIRVPRL